MKQCKREEEFGRHIEEGRREITRKTRKEKVNENKRGK